MTVYGELTAFEGKGKGAAPCGTETLPLAFPGGREYNNKEVHTIELG